MARTFHLTISRLGENLFEGEVASASLPGFEGRFEILAGHEAFVSELRAGQMRITTATGESQEFDVGQNGIAEISNNQATILLQ